MWQVILSQTSRQLIQGKRTKMKAWREAVGIYFFFYVSPIIDFAIYRQFFDRPGEGITVNNSC